MISGAQSVPGLGERVAACLAPWRDFAATAVRDVLAASPVARAAARRGGGARGGGRHPRPGDAGQPGRRPGGRARAVRPRPGGRRRARPAAPACRPARPGARRTAEARLAEPGRRPRHGTQAVNGEGRTDADRCGDRRVRLLGSGHRPRAARGRAPGAHADRASAAAGPARTASTPGRSTSPTRTALARDLAGAHTLYCTYWVRFPHGSATRESAVANSKILFDAAARAGIERIVYVSILHADTASPYPYFSGKGEVERHLAACGVPYAIARPGDPVRLVGRPGRRRQRPAQQHRLAAAPPARLRHRRTAAATGSGRSTSTTSPGSASSSAARHGQRHGRRGRARSRPTFREMVTAIRAATGSRSLLVPVPGWLIPPLAAVLGAALHDVLLTTEEYQAMAAGLADSDAPATGPGQPHRLDRRARRRARPDLRQRARPPLPLGEAVTVRSARARSVWFVQAAPRTGS